MPASERERGCRRYDRLRTFYAREGVKVHHLGAESGRADVTAELASEARRGARPDYQQQKPPRVTPPGPVTCLLIGTRPRPPGRAAWRRALQMATAVAAKSAGPPAAIMRRLAGSCVAMASAASESAASENPAANSHGRTSVPRRTAANAARLRATSRAPIACSDTEALPIGLVDPSQRRSGCCGATAKTAPVTITQQ